MDMRIAGLDVWASGLHVRLRFRTSQFPGVTMNTEPSITSSLPARRISSGGTYSGAAEIRVLKEPGPSAVTTPFNATPSTSTS